MNLLHVKKPAGTHIYLPVNKVKPESIPQRLVHHQSGLKFMDNNERRHIDSIGGTSLDAPRNRELG